MPCTLIYITIKSASSHIPLQPWATYNIMAVNRIVNVSVVVIDITIIKIMQSPEMKS